MTASTAYLKVQSDGLTGVNASLYVSGRSHIMCCTYPDRPPILALTDRCVSVSVTVPDRQQVTAGDLDVARHLADVVAEYIADLERHKEKQEREREGAADAA